MFGKLDPGEDPGCIFLKVSWFALLILSNCSWISNGNDIIWLLLFGLTKTKLFHFQRIFKNGVAERGVHADPMNPL